MLQNFVTILPDSGYAAIKKKFGKASGAMLGLMMSWPATQRFAKWQANWVEEFYILNLLGSGYDIWVYNQCERPLPLESQHSLIRQIYHNLAEKKFKYIIKRHFLN